jgi:hypothetical protein
MKLGKAYNAPPNFPGTGFTAVDALAVCLYNGRSGTLKVNVPGSPFKSSPYRYNLNNGTWTTKDNVNSYIGAVWQRTQTLGLTP